MEHLLVVVYTLAYVSQVGKDTWQQQLMTRGQAPILAFGTFHLVLDMDPKTKANKQTKKQCERTRQIGLAMYTLGLLDRSSLNRNSG